jgi:siderophore synthetase component
MDDDLSRVAGALLAKAISEFSYEGLLSPEPDGDQGWYMLRCSPGAGRSVVEYRFRAVRGDYDSWFVDPGSISRDDVPATDPLGFIADAAATLELPGDTAAHLVRELAATLTADLRIASTATLSSAQLADLGYAELEGHQTGHPWIVFNKGRLGFSTPDAARYAPEARLPMRLRWIAVHDELARYHAVPGLSEERLQGEELSEGTRLRFRERLASAVREPDRYHRLPVHPWQWDETIQNLYCAQIAAGRIVDLGESEDEYLPQQSIRTFSNVTAEGRRHVKLPLSVLNTMVWRGLPDERTVAAPAVTAWLQSIASADPFLTEECGLILLGEVASVTVPHPVLDRIDAAPYQYREMLGAIWREPLPAALRPGERARTLACLLSFGADGRPMIAELIARSGLTPADWLGRLLDALLPPLLHFLYTYGTAFSPHGENAIIVYDDRDIPTRLAVKDFVDDVNIADAPLPQLADLPPEVAAVLLREAPAYLCQFLHSGLFTGHFRYLAHIFDEHLGVPRSRFWALTRARVSSYQDRFPESADRYALFDLATPRIDRLCLNRNRLHLNGYHDLPERPHVEAFGTVPNPLCPPEHA